MWLLWHNRRILGANLRLIIPCLNWVARYRAAAVDGPGDAGPGLESSLGFKGWGEVLSAGDGRLFDRLEFGLPLPQAMEGMFFPRQRHSEFMLGFELYGNF